MWIVLASLVRERTCQETFGIQFWNCIYGSPSVSELDTKCLLTTKLLFWKKKSLDYQAHRGHPDLQRWTERLRDESDERDSVTEVTQTQTEQFAPIQVSCKGKMTFRKNKPTPLPLSIFLSLLARRPYLCIPLSSRLIPCNKQKNSVCEACRSLSFSF
jgi:hypothetical protein